jgi:hypothetical protein
MNIIKNKMEEKEKTNQLEKITTLNELLVYIYTQDRPHELVDRYNDFALSYTRKECQEGKAVGDMLNYLKKEYQE